MTLAGTCQYTTCHTMLSLVNAETFVRPAADSIIEVKKKLIVCRHHARLIWEAKEHHLEVSLSPEGWVWIDNLLWVVFKGK